MYDKNKIPKARIGNRILTVSPNVKISLAKNEVVVSGKLGIVKVAYDQKVLSVIYKDDKLFVKRNNENTFSKALHGTINALLKNALYGVEFGHQKKLKIVGIGYRCQLQGDQLVLSLGFSHQVLISIPEGIKVDIQQDVQLTIMGADKAAVGQLAAIIRAKKPPEPYKGKGILYHNEIIQRKAGKTAESSKK